MRYKDGDKFELSVVGVDGENACYETEIGTLPEEDLDSLFRRNSNQPLEKGMVVELEGGIVGVVTQVDQFGNVHFLFETGAVGVGAADKDLLYKPKFNCSAKDIINKAFDADEK